MFKSAKIESVIYNLNQNYVNSALDDVKNYYYHNNDRVGVALCEYIERNQFIEEDDEDIPYTLEDQARAFINLHFKIIDFTFNDFQLVTENRIELIDGVEIDRIDDQTWKVKIVGEGDFNMTYFEKVCCAKNATEAAKQLLNHCMLALKEGVHLYF